MPKCQPRSAWYCFQARTSYTIVSDYRLEVFKTDCCPFCIERSWGINFCSLQFEGGSSVLQISVHILTWDMYQSSFWTFIYNFLDHWSIIFYFPTSFRINVYQRTLCNHGIRFNSYTHDHQSTCRIGRGRRRRGWPCSNNSFLKMSKRSMILCCWYSHWYICLILMSSTLAIPHNLKLVQLDHFTNLLHNLWDISLRVETGSINEVNILPKDIREEAASIKRAFYCR